MSYKHIIEKARAKGITSEKAMLASIDDISDFLDNMKEAHPDEYWHFIRKTHATIYGPHYDEEFAKHDVSKMHSTDKDGKHIEGEYWTREQVATAYQGKVFPPGTTDCDKYVAAHIMKHDVGKHFSDSEVLDAAYLFFFSDEDGPEGKTWHYICAMYH